MRMRNKHMLEMIRILTEPSVPRQFAFLAPPRASRHTRGSQLLFSQSSKVGGETLRRRGSSTGHAHRSRGNSTGHAHRSGDGEKTTPRSRPEGQSCLGAQSVRIGVSLSIVRHVSTMKTLALTKILFLLHIALVCGAPFIAKRYRKTQQEDQNYWNNLAQNELKRALGVEKNTNVAKNVILFLGDGMSIPTLTAARIYKGQQHKRGGEEGHLTFESFHHVGLSKTYNVDKQVPDSAGTGTAYLTGVKTNYKTIGFDASIKYNDCQTMFRKQ
ncbi:putative alkaline phosphatase, tissue-nonspecific isozyme isoform X1 [Penaeus vannamei]|uniref:alkaline phosphatase n=1 Tax=Penaeus vannamei TaxID=6689 RepID=A0A3R7PII5_PENVA|nr:putative alkaline phosphatase, tissue-nonspecific isozyme isoform X1 [Penaeus vannamei]